MSATDYAGVIFFTGLFLGGTLGWWVNNLLRGPEYGPARALDLWL